MVVWTGAPFVRPLAGWGFFPSSLLVAMPPWAAHFSLASFSDDESFYGFGILAFFAGGFSPVDSPPCLCRFGAGSSASFYRAALGLLDRHILWLLS
jgi:hypothetical protein